MSYSLSFHECVHNANSCNAQDFYSVLGVSRNASKAEIKSGELQFSKVAICDLLKFVLLSMICAVKLYSRIVM